MVNIIQSPSKIESARFDALLSRLNEAAEDKDRGEVALLVEHLETAHAYLHGGMPLECVVNLELARQSAMGLSNRSLREECKRSIDGMLDRLAATNTPPVHAPDPWLPRTAATPQSEPSISALELTGYFHGSGLKLGAFYPNKHLVAVFDSFELASRGRQRLCHVGFDSKLVLAASGEEFGKFLEDLRISRSLTATVMTQVSRLLDTEAGLVDQYAEWARLGSGFLVVFSPTEASAWQISSILFDLNPQAEHWFAPTSIHSFT
jgi:hypothetical protein